MLRAGLVWLLLLAPTPLTSLTVDAPAPAPATAGETRRVPVTVELTGPHGRIPGLSGPVNLTPTAAPGAGCALAERTLWLDPATGRAATNLTCRPALPGEHPLAIDARAPPHESGRWEGQLPVAPDTLQGGLTASPASNETIQIAAELAPVHLDAAQVNVTVTGTRANDERGFVHGPVAFEAKQGATLYRRLMARHGPGTYELELAAEGPATLPFTTRTTVTVPEAPEDDELDVDARVEELPVELRFTGDGVNANGTNKYPGQTLTTRVAVENADAVAFRVLRPAGEEGRIELAAEHVPVEDGQAEHRFSEPVLPAGTLFVEASAGEARVERTAEIQDAATDLVAEAVPAVLADGRPVPVPLRFEDANLGSTPSDPGPVRALPDVTWTVYRGSRVLEGANVTLGPWSGGAQGQAPTSRIPWPAGLEGVHVEAGHAELVAEITPPLDVEPGRYRLSVYEAGDGDLLGTAPFELAPAPEPVLSADPPRPGHAWPIEVQIADPRPEVTTHLALVLDDGPVAHANVTGNGTAELVVPEPLPAGRTIAVEATSRWPGRPPPQAPDAILEDQIVDVGPRVTLAPRLDGRAVQAPVAIHPGQPHDLDPGAPATDPNGDPVSVRSRLIGPEGGTVASSPSAASDGNLTVPAGLPAGRYTLAVEAESSGGSADAERTVDVGEVVRVRLGGPTSVLVPAGGRAQMALTVRNAGSVPVEDALLTVDAGEIEVEVEHAGSTVPLRDLFTVELDPGEAVDLDVTLHAAQAGEGEHRIRFHVAGG